MNKKLINFQKLYRSTWDMDIYFMYEINDILSKKLNGKVLFKNLKNPKTTEEKIGKAFVLSNLCNLDPWELGNFPEENKECYDEVIKLLPEILDSGEKHYLSKWLSERSVEYLKSASKIVNLEYYSFTYKGEEKTQKELVKVLIELSKKATENYSDENFDELMELWGIFHRVMWW